ncbi:MAG: hypothetical protein P857_649 [Candidatus Xenolissoclinum pacificiensis L6]|uniref:Bacterial virulence protein VirB8 domain-containing protein n=1 Tax=Candidatus Xenolissoclinum pacificiensis L6 TaxID=1401685 RepID=W2UYG4_9RICK|nr:MAG: hypothetical protein P857_649 [Candidatus Xenolissoclinum pacificiensis L6]
MLKYEKLKDEKLVHSLIEKDCYFIESFEWYMQKYVLPITSTIYLWCMIGLLMICTAVLFGKIFSLFPLSVRVPFIMYVEHDSYDKRSILNRLSYDKVLNNNVAKYLLSEYVRSYEGYDYNLLQYKMAYIKSNSIYDIYKKYRQKNDFANSDSPIRIYKDVVVKRIEIVSIDIIENFELNARAEVVFNSYLDDKMVDSQKVYIDYQLSDVMSSYKKFFPLEFTVISYDKKDIL